jgi:hypothetical protein
MIDSFIIESLTIYGVNNKQSLGFGGVSMAKKIVSFANKNTATQHGFIDICIVYSD